MIVHRIQKLHEFSLSEAILTVFKVGMSKR
jgi:hypothetical protein